MSESFGAYDPSIAADFVRQFEGLSLKAYLCPAGVWTIGYGHTSGVKEGDEIDQSEADALLIEDLTNTASELARLVNVPVTRGQYVALMSLAFNLGVRNLVRTCPKLLRSLNERRFDDCAVEFSDVVYANGRKLQGLVRRRAAEMELFLNDSD